MSRLLTLSGNKSTLSAYFFPPIELSPSTNYECGLVSLFTFNSIPNVDKNNNLLHVGEDVIEIPEGSYEVDDITNYITKKLKDKGSKNKVIINANTNTLKVEITATEALYFDNDRTIGKLLGFSKSVIPKNVTHISDLPVNINKVNSVRVECSIVTGSYINGRPGHTIHKFSPDVLPGFKINEVPQNIIYLPVNVNVISSIVVDLIDQDGNPVDFRAEEISLTLHLRPQ